MSTINMIDYKMVRNVDEKYRVELRGGLVMPARNMQEVKRNYRFALNRGWEVESIMRMGKNGKKDDVLGYIKIVA
jgi:hypothetical protein